MSTEGEKPKIAPPEYRPEKGKFALVMFDDVEQRVSKIQKDFTSFQAAADEGRALERKCLTDIPFVVNDEGHITKVSDTLEVSV